MRKSFIYVFTVAAAITAAGLAPATAHAAIHTYTIPAGKGQAVIIGGNNMGDLNEILNQIGGSLGQNGIDCGPLFPGTPENPGNGVPGSQIPGNMLPDPDFNGQGQPEVNQDSMAAQVVKLVNEERTKAGLAPLTVDSSITAAAQTRAKEIETSFSHTRPNGTSFSTALDAAGVNYRSSGENIAYGQNSAAQVMQGWMNSSGHRANILNGSFTRIGVGHYKSASGVDYWTQLFAN